MHCLEAFVLSYLVVAVRCNRDFPPGFKFGAATAAYQVEGAWNVSDKSKNVWDHLLHVKPEVIIDRSNGDVACDSYHQWKKDVEIASELGLNFYRFSIAWTRLVPNGFSKHISEDGKKYYNNLIDALLEKGIEPVVTLYHWDLPQSLQDLGGWTNPMIVDWFADYARTAYTLFGDRVKTWITLNEPIIFCEVVYGTGLIAPRVKSPGIGNYICNKNTLLAHAKAWRIYDKEFRPKYHGKVSLTNHLTWFEPTDETEEEAASLTRELSVGMYSHAVYSKEGGWPPVIEKLIAEKSKKEGYSRSRLPAFTEEEKKFVKGTYDFYGFNQYTSRIVRKAKEGDVIGWWPMFGAPEIDVFFSVRPQWKQTASTAFFVNPEGLRHQLVWLKQHYGNISIFITENGYAGRDAPLDDQDVDRVEYYEKHLEQVLLAIKEDGVNVIGYTAWTMIDNFEWLDGYNTKFGLYEVDFQDPKRARRPRSSARYYASVIKSHSLDVHNKVISEELYLLVLLQHHKTSSFNSSILIFLTSWEVSVAAQDHLQNLIVRHRAGRHHS